MSERALNSVFSTKNPPFLTTLQKITPDSQSESQTPQGFWSVTPYCIIIATVARAVTSGAVIERYCKLQLLSDRH